MAVTASRQSTWRAVPIVRVLSAGTRAGRLSMLSAPRVPVPRMGGVCALLLRWKLCLASGTRSRCASAPHTNYANCTSALSLHVPFLLSNNLNTSTSIIRTPQSHYSYERLTGQ